MKRIINLLLGVTLLVCSFTVSYAKEDSGVLEVSPRWSYEGEKNVLYIDFSAQLDETFGGEKVFIKMMKEGTDETSSLTNLEKYAYAYVVFADPDGKVNHSFLFDGESSVYLIQIISDTMDEKLEKSVYVPSASKMEEILNKMKKGEFTNSQLAAELSQNAEKIGVWSEGFKLLSESSEQIVASYLIEKSVNYTAEEFETVYDEALLVKGINANEEADTVKNIFEKYISITNIENNSLYLNFNKLSESGKLDFYKCLSQNDYNSKEEIEDAFFKNLSLEEMKNAARYSDIGKIADKYKNALLPDEVFEKYFALSNNERDKANLYIVKDIKLVKSFSELKNIFDNANENAKKPSASNNGSNSSGTGDGGGNSVKKTDGFSLLTSTPSVPLDVIEDENAVVFSDVPKSYWGYEAIMELYNKNIVSGKTKTTFAPEDKITREEFTKLLISALKAEDNEAECEFSDVSKNDWSYIYISSAVKTGIIVGYSDYTFGKKNNITRQDAALMIYRAFAEAEEISSETFADDEAISEYAKQAVYSLKSKKIINGHNNEFNPTGFLKRSEAAQMIRNLLNKDNK